jgi:hypothetical protein
VSWKGNRELQILTGPLERQKGRIILKWILKEIWGAGTELIWLRIKTSGGLL